MSRKPKPAPAEALKSEPPAAAPAAAIPDPAAELQAAPETTGAVSPPASAAAEATAAPVATPTPTPDAAQASAAVKGHVVRVIGPAKGRWRAGRKFGPEAVEIPASELTVEDLEKLMGDPELACLVVGDA